MTRRGLVVLAALALGGCGSDPPPATVRLETRMVRAAFVDTSDGTVVPTQSIAYRYDDAGRMIAVERTLAGVRAGGAVLRYDDDGQLITIESTRIDGALRSGDRLTLAYDDRGRLAREDHYASVDAKLDDEWRLAIVYDNVYDDDDRLSERIGRVPGPNDTLFDATRARYAYGTGTLLATETDGYFENGAWTDQIRYTLEYTGDVLHDVVTSHAVGTTWVPDQRFTFEVSAPQLRRISGERRHEAAAAWHPEEWFEYAYGDDGVDPAGVIKYAVEGVRRELARVTYTYEARPVIVPLSFTRTRIHGITDPELIKFLYTIGR